MLLSFAESQRGSVCRQNAQLVALAFFSCLIWESASLGGGFVWSDPPAESAFLGVLAVGQMVTLKKVGRAYQLRVVEAGVGHFETPRRYEVLRVEDDFIEIKCVWDSKRHLRIAKQAIQQIVFDRQD